MQYCVVYADELDELDVKVNEFIAQGWNPLGGVAKDESGHKYLQAMVKP
jgi:hypothetical protein